MSAKLAAVALAAALCTGCLRSTTVISVKADGSGTVEQTMLVNMGFVKGMFNGLGGGQATQTPGTVNEADLQRSAQRMGEGVTFVSATPMKTDDGFEGSKATFAFTDVTKLRVDQDPNLSGSTTGGFSTPPKNENPVTFGFTKGTDGVSTLTVTLNEKKGAGAPTPQGGPDMDNPQMLDMMRSMFKGFRVGIDVVVAGKIVKTNADHVAGSRVTLLEMDMEKLLADEAKLKEVQKALGPGASVSELRPYLKDVQGLKVNDPVVTISFR